MSGYKCLKLSYFSFLLKKEWHIRKEGKNCVRRVPLKLILAAQVKPKGFLAESPPAVFLSKFLIENSYNKNFINNG